MAIKHTLPDGDVKLSDCLSKLVTLLKEQPDLLKNTFFVNDETNQFIIAAADEISIIKFMLEQDDDWQELDLSKENIEDDLG